MIKINYTLDENGVITSFWSGRIKEKYLVMEVEEETLNQMNAGYSTYINGVLTTNFEQYKQDQEKNAPTKEEIKKEKLRKMRKPLLEAFDIYKSNVSYGVVDETEQEHIVISQWYLDLLDLKPNALDNVPECIGRYL